MPGATDGPPSAMTVPNLAIPNALVNLLRTPGPAITPHEFLNIVDEFIQNSSHPPEQQWECVRCWCLVACQTGTNGKSGVFLDTVPVTIDDNEFDQWVWTKLDVTLGPRPSGATPIMMAAAGCAQAMNYLAMSKMLATTIGANMMQFSQPLTPVLTGGVTAGNDTTLAPGKSFNQDQIAKLQDACGMRNAQQIPTIWAVIQGSKGKSFDTYHNHLAKSVKLWCRTHHIDRDKSIFLNSKFFKDLVALRFNPGGPVVQYQSAARGMSMVACRSLTAVEAKYRRDYEEVAAHTTNMQWSDDLLKGNRGKTMAPAGMYMELKLNIGSYCSLLWSLSSDHCDYYKELLKLYCILDREECFTIQEAYTKEVCTRITWAIVDDGQYFFGQHPVASDFALGAQFHFSSSFLKGITDAVRNALVIQWTTFPREWLSPAAPEHTYGTIHTPAPPSGLPPTHWPAPARCQAPWPQHSQQGRKHVICNCERLWTHTSYGTTISSICWTYSLRPESK
jgi:hypothetical protein